MPLKMPSTPSGSTVSLAIIKNLGTIILLMLLIPFNLAAIVLSLLRDSFRKDSRSDEQPSLLTSAKSDKKRILITGAKMTKALQLARAFDRDGHDVYFVETHKYWLSGHRFSRAVKGFFTVPAPQEDSDGYCQGLLQIVKAHDIDLFVPVSSPIASYYDALAKDVLAPYCESMHLDAATMSK
jgi:hypothetical protein